MCGTFRDNEIMLLENLFTYFKKELKARQEQTKEAITTGVKDLEEYRYLTGKLHALQEAEQELTDLLKKQELDDE